MDIYRFIDSHDIREHLRRLDYQFTTPEAAFLTWYCHTATLDEKIAAWREIIDTMPNCSMGPRRFGLDIPNFHKFLRRYIDLQMRYLQQFRDATGGVYSWKALFARREENVSSVVYTNYFRCLDAAKDWAANDNGCTGFVISKNLIGVDQKRSWADSVRFNRNSQIVSVHCLDTCEEDSDLSTMFTCMWFAFPTPFHAGDIVCDLRNPDRSCVLADLCTWTSENAREELPLNEMSRGTESYDHVASLLEKDGDITDMSWSGYAMQDSGEGAGIILVDGCGSRGNYLDLEFACKPLADRDRPLEVVSAYFKEHRTGRPAAIDDLLNNYIALIARGAHEQRTTPNHIFPSKGIATDIYHFIDSCDIREHLKQLNYQFTTPEAAFLVWHCHTATLDEKIATWQEIISNMPNCSMDARRCWHRQGITDFHDFLRQYITLQNRYVQKFKSGEDVVYQWKELCEDERSEVDPYVYATYEQCFNEAMKWMVECEEDETCNESHLGFVIEKLIVNPSEEQQADCLFFNHRGQITNMSCIYDTEEDFTLSNTFDGMFFAFPTPFHAGDIVCNIDKPNDPFVLSSMQTWDEKQVREELPQKSAKEAAAYGHLLAEHKKNGDVSDMMCYGYTMWDQRESEGLLVAYVDGVDYLDIELARKPLEGAYQPLKAISYYFEQCRAGKPILIDVLLNSYVALVSKAFYESTHSWVENSIGYRWIDDLAILPNNPND